MDETYTFNKHGVCVDLKFLVDAQDSKHIALTAACSETLYHVVYLVKNGVRTHVMRVFVEKWVTHNDVLEIVVCYTKEVISNPHWRLVVKDWD